MSNIEKLLEGIDKRTKRYKRSKAELEARARPGELKTVTVKRIGEKNAGVPETVELRSGFCPCSICGHQFMWECDDAQCQCCSSVCT